MNGTSGAALLEARDLTVSFGGIVALDDVSFAVGAREIVGLIGPNGAGKTTCFGVLSGLLRPRAGEVLVDGRDITTSSPQARARAGIARTFQRLELFGELTVREHLAVAYRAHRRPRLRDAALRLPLDLLGLGSRPDPDETPFVDETLELLGLSRSASVPASALGLGTGRLVEIARALAAQPRVLLLDEPSSGLDARETAELTDVFRRLREERGVAIVLVEHDVEMVLGLADRVTVLDFGRVIAHGSPADVRADPAVQAAYLGTSS